MRGFTDQELADFAEKRKRSNERLNQAVADARRIGQILNEIHGTEFSDDFWMFLVLPHVRRLQIMEHQQNLAKDLGTADQNNNTRHPTAGLRQQVSKIVRTSTQVIRLVKQRINFGKLSRELKAHRTLVYGFHDVVEIKKKGQLIPSANPALFPGRQSAKRELIAKSAANAGSKRLCRAIETLPDLLVERFLALLRRVPLHAPERKQFHVSIGVSDFMSLMFALYRERGAEIHRYQHGSHYGEQEAFRVHERISSSKFHTGGWTSDDKDVPDYAYRLAGFKRGYVASDQDELYDLLVCVPAVHRNNLVRRQEDVNKISRSLDRKRYNRVLFRPRLMSRFDSADAILKPFEIPPDEIDAARGPIAQ